VRGPGAILLSRSGPAGLDDLASRLPLIAGQRVRRARLTRRIRRRARRLVVTAGLVALSVAALGAAGLGVHWALTSPRFGVAHVDVVGARQLTPEAVVETAGIAAGENLWRLDARAAVERLLTLPLVKDARVERRPPDRVVLAVVEREPYALVQAERLHWVDSEGVDLGVAPRAVAPPLPVISGVDPGALGGPRQAAGPALEAGLALLRLLDGGKSPLLSRISEIDAGRPEDPVLVLLDGMEVRLGHEAWDARLARLSGVLAQLEASNGSVTIIDLRFRDQVVLKPGVP
jgi:cell division protein FtsQ